MILYGVETEHILLKCLLPDVFTSLTLRSVTDLGQYVKLFRFDLPSSRHTTGMNVGEYIAVRAKINNEEQVRYYSPVSRPDDPGHLDLLIKVDESGIMSHYMNSLQPGIDSLEFKGPLGTNFPLLDWANQPPANDDIANNLRRHDAILPSTNRQSTTPIRRIAMIAGGTGISPMIQIIRSVLFHHRTDIQLKLLYGACAESEFVCKDILEQKTLEYPNFDMYLTVDNPTETWPKDDPRYGTGYMNSDVLRHQLLSPGLDLLIIVCGPRKMCQNIKTILLELGYPETMWYSYM